MSKWIVNVKGKANSSFEIAIVRENNKHGINSYGDFDEDKLLISSSGGPCGYTVLPVIWNKLIKVAHSIVDGLNLIEQSQSPTLPNLHGVYHIERCIPKKDLVHGTEYKGHCRNASKAVWNVDKQKFTYIRIKFGSAFLEDINHPEDDNGFDLFVPWEPST